MIQYGDEQYPKAITGVFEAKQAQICTSLAVQTFVAGFNNFGNISTPSQIRLDSWTFIFVVLLFFNSRDVMHI